VTALVVVLFSFRSLAADAPAPIDAPTQGYMAVPLDQDGKLAEALPLYRAQADATVSKADRLRYAGALLRAGRSDEAQAIYEQVSADANSDAHGGGAEVNPALCASSLLASGFPARAVPYARQAHALRADDPTLLLLLVRALAASGDAAGARGALKPVARVPSDWTIGQRIELARWRWLTGDAAGARQILDGKPPEESVAQMFRDSLLANAPSRRETGRSPRICWRRARARRRPGWAISVSLANGATHSASSGRSSCGAPSACGSPDSATWSPPKPPRRNAATKSTCARPPSCSSWRST
jgi:hypothetical protein